MSGDTPDPIRFLIESVGLRYTDDFAAPLRENLPEVMYVGGVRSSKTTHEVLEVFKRVPRWVMRNIPSKTAEEPEGRETLVWVMAAKYALTDQEYKLLVRWSQRIGLHLSSSENIEGGHTMRWRGNIRLVTRATDNEERIAAEAPDLVLVCEAGQVTEKARDYIRERALEKAAPIVWGGTLEDGEGQPRWAWYEEAAQDWQENPTRRHKCFSLPTWENPMWWSCEPWLSDDETGTLSEFCPDEDHGPAHSYWDHPQVRAYREMYPEDTYVWKRRYAAIPTGVQFAVYPGVSDHLLQPVSQVHRLGFFASAGGIDYGTTENHPSALVVVQLTDDPRDREPFFIGPRGIAWVRECIVLRDGGNATSLKRARKELSDRWKVRRWQVDPNERFMAKNFEGESTSYSESARLARHGIVRARLDLKKLFFDQEGPGVRELLTEMKAVHYRKDKMGQFHPHRERDDRTAALEDALELLDGEKLFAMPKAQRIHFPRGKRREEFVPI